MSISSDYHYRILQLTRELDREKKEKDILEKQLYELKRDLEDARKEIESLDYARDFADSYL